MGCYILYSTEGPGLAAAPPSPLLAVPNVTAHGQCTNFILFGVALCTNAPDVHWEWLFRISVSGRRWMGCGGGGCATSSEKNIFVPKTIVVRPWSYLGHPVKRCKRTPASSVINKRRRSRYVDNTRGVTRKLNRKARLRASFLLYWRYSRYQYCYHYEGTDLSDAIWKDSKDT